MKEGNELVDFSQHSGRKKKSKIFDPVELYENLDRRSDKGPLRPAQKQVLQDWFASYKAKKDIILKLHTGQGKTLVGLLLLQARLNEFGGPALYVCPNKFLAEQTRRQAEEFGINCVDMSDDLPPEFLDGQAILVTHVQKVFNGWSKFGIKGNSENVDGMVIDDAHACIDSIRDASTISLKSDHPAYKEIVDLFSEDLKEQGLGTYQDIQSGVYNSLMPVPYWAWYDRRQEVSEILSRNSESNEVKFSWPLIRDILQDCCCVVSGKELKITPYDQPLYQFGTFYNANQRVFMSATMSDDSFLVKGFGVNRQAILNPLRYPDEKWSGEKMVLIPSLIDESLDKTEMGAMFGPSSDKRKVGIAVLVPSGKSAEMWERYGAKKVGKVDISEEVENLREGEFSETRIFVNRYDGIDLPDDSCRILILDGKPFAEDIFSRYEESVRANSEIIKRKAALKIEQGMGRSVRGEKDYSVIIITSSDLVRMIRGSRNLNYFSVQTKKQIEIGLEISEMARQEIEDGSDPKEAFKEVVRQSLKRDEDWKAYYASEMDECEVETLGSEILDILVTEVSALKKYRKNDPEKAVNEIQKMLDSMELEDSDRGWYLQEMARMLYPTNKSRSQELQKAAHSKNGFLLKPHGIEHKQISLVAEARAEKIRGFLQQFGSVEDVNNYITEVLDNLKFGVDYEKFESSLDALGKAIGLETERPEKVWKEGPDNIWAVEDGRYILFEAKNEVSQSRRFINKHEVGQMNISIAWFLEEYRGCYLASIMIIPTNKLERRSRFSCEVGIMKGGSLGMLVENARRFFSDLVHMDPASLSDTYIQRLLNSHYLDSTSLETRYSEAPKISGS